MKVFTFENQYRLQAGRCWLCQAFTLPQNLTRAHLVPRSRGGTIGADYAGAVLMHRECNRNMGAMTAGSDRFTRWIRQVIKHGRNWPFIRRDAIVIHSPS